MVAKKFTEIDIPLLGSSIKFEGNPEDIEGKSIKMDLTRMLKGKSIEVIFVVNSKELKAYPKKLTLLAFYIRRLMKKGTDYVEDSFVCKSKEFPLNIKTFFITRRKVSRKIRKALRDKAKEIVIKFCEDKTLDEVILEVISGRLQKEIAITLKKIYPLSVCEITYVAKKKQ